MSRRFVLILLSGVVLLGSGLLLMFQSQPVQVWYHRQRMHSAWKKMYSDPRKTADGFYAYSLGDSNTQFESERQILVKLGDIREINYQFRHLRTLSPE